MMDHKTVLNRDAKAAIMLMIADIPEDRKKELIEKYHNPEKHLKSANSQKILIGNWFNNAIKMFLKGATEDELKRVTEHLVVLLGAVKYELDVQRSYMDNDLFGLTKKYFKVFKKMEIEGKPVFIETDDPLEKRRLLVEKRNNLEREKMKKKVNSMKESGYSNEQIAKELKIPESTIRNLVKTE